MEAGGALLALVAIVAIATFAYIGFMLSRDPQKAAVVAEGVEEATEGTAEDAIEVTTVATNESKLIHDTYIELGYPDDDGLPKLLTNAIASAYEAGKLPIVDQLFASTDEGAGHAAIVSAAVPGEVNPNVCGLYGQELCFLVYHNDLGTKVLTVFDAMSGSPHAKIGSPVLERFADDRQTLLFVSATGDGPESHETGYAVLLDVPGSVFEVARVDAVLTPPMSTAVSVRGEPQHSLTFVMEEVGRKVAGDITITDMRIAVSDGTKDLGVIEGSYNADTETVVSVDYAKTFADSFFNADDWFGINVWVLGNLYRYDGNTLSEVIE